jgi:cell division protein FtsA
LAKDNIIVGLDIGSSKIRTVISSVNERDVLPNIVGAGVSRSSGLRKGVIVDVNETISAITASLEDAERMSGSPIHHAVIAVGGAHLASINSRGVIAVPHGGEISPGDIERVLEAAQAVNIQANRQILRVIPQNYTIDDQTGIRNPIGMKGVRLEVEAHIITALAPALKNLETQFTNQGLMLMILCLLHYLQLRLFFPNDKKNLA